MTVTNWLQYKIHKKREREKKTVGFKDGMRQEAGSVSRENGIICSIENGHKSIENGRSSIQNG